MSAIKGVQPQINFGKEVGPAPEAKDPKILEVARGFENQFLSQMVKSMRKTTPGDALFPNSFANQIYRDQLDGEYTKNWSDAGGIGLADIIYDQMAEKYLPKSNVAAAKLKPQPVAPTVTIAQRKDLTDLFSREDGNRFEAAKGAPGEFHIRSKEPLTSEVLTRSPISGLVLQAASLEDGRQMVSVKHDQGLVTQFVHNGKNHVKSGSHIAAGDPLFALGPRENNMPSEIVLRLRKASND